MDACELLTRCEFFQRYGETHNRLCQGFIDCYCRGPLWDRCARKGFARDEGGQPDVRMMPSGEMIE